MAVRPNVGDYVFTNYRHINGTIIGDRGGYVGRWVIRTESDETLYCSSRDITIIKSAAPRPYTRLTTDEKLDMLLEYLNLEIRDEPELVEIKKADDNGQPNQT